MSASRILTYWHWAQWPDACPQNADLAVALACHHALRTCFCMAAAPPPEGTTLAGACALRRAQPAAKRVATSSGMARRHGAEPSNFSISSSSPGCGACGRDLSFGKFQN